MTSNVELPEIFRDLVTIDPDKEIVFCKNCTMSNQRPRIQFNNQGFCSPCVFHQYKNKFIDWDKREKELSALCDKHRKDDGTWDVIVPSSGGKDSSYVSYILKEKYGMNPLTVTWAPAIPTNIGQENLFNMAYTGQDNILFTPNGIVHRKLSKASLIEFGDNFIPFAYGQINVPLQCALRFNIPFVMYGENGDLEYGGSVRDYDRPTLRISTTTIEDKFTGLPTPAAASDLAKENWLPEGVKIEDLKLYLPPLKKELDRIKIKEYYFSYYENWKPEEHVDIAKKHCGYKINEKRTEGTYTNFASLDDKLDGFHYYLMFIKQGIGRTTSDTAHQVRQEIITRDEGVELVTNYDGEFPSKHLDLFLDYMEMNMDELNQVFDKYRRPIVWEREKEEWKLRQQVTKL
jgi:N-acetyl sugar amidotransferase